MSLINEALKRAKEAQETPQSGTSSVPQLARFQPAPSHPSTGILPSITLGLVAMLGFVVVWQWIHLRNIRGGSSPTPLVTAKAKSNAGRPTAPAPTPPPVAKTTVPVQPARPAVPVPPPNASKQSTNSQAFAAPPPVASPSTNAGRTATSAVAVAKEPAAKPVVLKLQAIVSHPTRPSAVINGRSLFVGDHISEFRVSKISSQNVTLEGRKINRVGFA